MITLQASITRLAHDVPGLRRHLVPLLRLAAERQKWAFKQKKLVDLLQREGEFGIISAYRTSGDDKKSKHQNKVRHGQLLADLQKMGYRTEDLESQWEPVPGSGKFIPEKSLLVKGISADDLFKLGEKYNQDATIHKSKDGVVGMYDRRNKTVTVAVDPKTALPAVDVSQKKNEYSKTRNWSFSLGFLWGKELPWNGKTPVTGKTVRKELTDVSEDRSFEQAIQGKKFKNPETGNRVLFDSLPLPDQSRIRQQWQAQAS